MMGFLTENLGPGFPQRKTGFYLGLVSMMIHLLGLTLCEGLFLPWMSERWHTKTMMASFVYDHSLACMVASAGIFVW